MPVDRFLTLSDVAEVLNISASQTYALVRSGELPAIKIGGRGQWRVERDQLESYIARMYTETRDFVQGHPLARDETGSAGLIGVRQITRPGRRPGRRGGRCAPD